ncbi:hypothetical protein PHSY_005655 [Pseudozyma hubeiensis SY62]|uniref:Uncharacterized protein n=1 Tax=Pseudozyma hubeiensis (strain SY62) TaxID=1305764 RepID=R9P9L8_PSEHS|nr:hypothetical protein PHSY_005655 [Pseudozyma hubeiensis SY62]GAC98066.1 hypothetical protein PHSY_005655 [Pseudozyma hubeiensis SY62]
MAPQILTSIYPPLPKASFTNIFDYVSSESESSLADKVQFVRQDGKQYTRVQNGAGRRERLFVFVLPSAAVVGAQPESCSACISLFDRRAVRNLASWIIGSVTSFGSFGRQLTSRRRRDSAKFDDFRRSLSNTAFCTFVLHLTPH